MTSPDFDTGSVLVVGYGNLLRGDDAAGWRVIESIADDPRFRAIQTIALHQLTVDLLEDMRHAFVVVFVDASVEIRPGHFATREVVPTGRDELGHRLTPGALVAMAETLYGEPVTAFEVLIGGRAFEFGDRISPAVEGTVTMAVESVLEIASGCVEMTGRLANLTR